MAEDKGFSVKTLMKFFGKKEGQDLAGFGQELKQLSDEEKIQLSKGIEDETLNY